MAQLFGIDIPPEFEILFKQLLQLPIFNTIQTGNTKPAKQVFARKKRTSSRSLFLIFQSTYDGLSSGRKTAWTTYWGTLPFGPHSGAGEWPGSGFSAFVYVNAFRYKNGLALLLDAPGANLLVNPNFKNTLSPWQSVEVDGWQWHKNYAVDYQADQELYQPLALTSGATYHMTVTYQLGIGYSPMSFYFGFLIMTNTNRQLESVSDYDAHIVEYDFVARPEDFDGTDIYVAIRPDDVGLLIKSVTLYLVP